jgi:DNA invertase Pin-like site-specific DNA recombinase
MQVAGYVRRSTDKQAMSPETQAGLLQAAADFRGWDLTIHEERAASGKTLDGRPVLAALLDDLEPGQALAVAALDRLSRSVLDTAGLLVRAEQDGWHIVALADGVDTTRDRDPLLAHIRAAVAEDERRRIARRTREGMARIRATTGKHMGRPSLIPPEVEARIIALHDDGQSASAIARLLNSEGVPKGPGSSPLWNHSHVIAAVRREQVRRAATG